MPYDSEKIKAKRVNKEIIEILEELLDIVKDGNVTSQEHDSTMDKIKKIFKRK